MYTVEWSKLRYYIGNILYMIGLAQIVPFIASIILGESIIFSTILGLSALILVGIAWFIKRDIPAPPEISLADAYIVTTIAFLVPAITCAIPIMAYGVDPLNALFEGVSAITTTGLSALPKQALTPGVQFLRAYYQWLGGVSIALIVVSFLLTPGSSAYNIYLAHLGRYKLTPLSISTIKIILKIYVFFTIIFTITYVLTGLPLFDSIINALTTISTGGFSTLEEFRGNVMYAGMVLMFISAQPLALYYFLFRGKTRDILNDPQLRSFTIITIASYLIIILLTDVLKPEYLFQVISALSTTGYSALDNASLPDSLKFLFSMLMIMGAGFGSTGGGIKQLRVYLFLKSIIHSLKKQVLPSKAVSHVKISGHIVSDAEITQVHNLILIYMLVLVFSVLIIASYGYNLADSLFECSSALATTGLSVGLSSPSLQPIPKIVLIINMFLGRLEIVPVLITLFKIFHFEKGK